MDPFTPDAGREYRQLWAHPWSVDYVVPLRLELYIGEFIRLANGGVDIDKHEDWYTGYVHPEAEC